MKLKDLKIGTQLRFGLGGIFVLVLLLGGQAWFQAESLWQQAQGLHDHPLMVRRALGELKSDILAIHNAMGDAVLFGDDPEKQLIFQEVAKYEANAERQIAVMRDCYLGPAGDVDDISQRFAQWRAVRAETARLLEQGKTAEARNRMRLDGACHGQVDALMKELNNVSDFALTRGDRFYEDARQNKHALLVRLAFSVGAIVLALLVIGYFLTKSIKRPLAELTAVADQLRRGKMDVRSRQSSTNEMGVLSAAFDAMADTIQIEMRVNEHAAKLAAVMLREDEVHAFCRELLRELLLHTGSQVGAVYFLNEAGTAFEHFESIGLGAGGRAAFSATQMEGELGAALAARTIQRISDIPSDTRFTFTAVSGEFKPREIMTIPVLSDHSASAVISLASIRPFDEPSIRLVNDIWGILTARVNGVLAYRKIQNLAAALEHQNRELDAQKKELAVQKDELTEQNTELEMQKRQLDESSRLKTMFLSNMSHELRTPLNSVIALTGVLSRRLAKSIPAEEHGYLNVIERNGKNLLALINDILDLSRIEAGREEVAISHFPVRELADEITAMLEPQAAEKKIAVHNRVSGNLSPVSSDYDKCRHILQNLVGNAVKFTERGEVVVTAEVISDPLSVNSLRISVTDTGIGIAADQLPHIFDEFRQGDGSTSRKYGGTGLGLAIAKKYAELLSGDITVQSTPGKGSTFTLRLPMDAAVAAGRSGADVEGGRPDRRAAATGPIALRGTDLPTARGQSILVVEDNEPAIIQLTDILQAEGYRIQVARNGKEALEQIRQAVPDAMILDLMMPEVDGFQVLKEIRGAEHSSRLPVLILTAKHVTREELSFLTGNHIHQLIRKGDIDKAGLLAAVARMVGLQPHARPAPPAPRIRRRPERPGKPLLLVVEDNVDNLHTLRALLMDAGQIVEATDGAAALELARTRQPDLILTDIALPGLDGVQLLQAIRKDEALRDIPVLAVTASAMKGARETLLAQGFDGYVSKPIDHDELMRTLREHV
jgi:signal transduction histidine kinase/DNA-binding response OmpR family regulator/HAMP domain-containing protein